MTESQPTSLIALVCTSHKITTYVDIVNGSDETGDGTLSNTYKTIVKAGKEITDSILDRYDSLEDVPAINMEMRKVTVNDGTGLISHTIKTKEKYVRRNGKKVTFSFGGEEDDPEDETTCMECGSHKYTVLKYDAGDFDYECVECGSISFA